MFMPKNNLTLATATQIAAAIAVTAGVASGTISLTTAIAVMSNVSTAKTIYNYASSAATVVSNLRESERQRTNPDYVIEEKDDSNGFVVISDRFSQTNTEDNTVVILDKIKSKSISN